MKTTSSQKHAEIVQAIEQIKGVQNVRSIFEQNKTSVSFRFNVTGEFNYSNGRLSIDHKNELVFLPDIGNRFFEGLKTNEILEALHERYKKL
jgi:hypothetical protein